MQLIRQNQEKFKAYNQPRMVNKILASNNFPGVYSAVEYDDAVEERCEETLGDRIPEEEEEQEENARG